jgi:hypothetical protein
LTEFKKNKKISDGAGLPLNNHLLFHGKQRYTANLPVLFSKGKILLP